MSSFELIRRLLSRQESAHWKGKKGTVEVELLLLPTPALRLKTCLHQKQHRYLGSLKVKSGPRRGVCED